MQKVNGVSAVRVSLNEGLTVLDLKPGNTVTLARLRDVIRNNGFVTREAQVTAVGTVSSASGSVVFDVAGSQERFTVLAGSGLSAQRYDDLRARTKAGAAGPLSLTGAVDITDPKAIKMTVTAIAPP
jgi:hypothetical protein